MPTYGPPRLRAKIRGKHTMTRVYLIRHGEAEGNLYRRAQGTYDGRITAKGERQIDALAARFRDVPVDALISSDLSRTLRTAEAITRYHDLPLQRDARLRELDLGPWENVPYGDLHRDDPQQLYNFNNDPARWLVPGAESFAHAEARMRAAVFDAAARYPGRTVVCVSHGTVIRTLLAGLMGIPSAEIRRLPHGDNTAVSLLEIGDDGSVRAAFVNDSSHLPTELSTFARQSWWKDAKSADLNNVSFRRFSPEKYPKKYCEYYEKTWLAVHGSLDGFHAPLYLASAIQHEKACPDALVSIVRQDGEAVGLIELDTERGAVDGWGWICLCFVEEPVRRKLLGVHLIGHAVSVFRALGRSAVRLSVFEGNAGALRFYETCGFRVVGGTPGVSGRLLVMEKEL